VFQPFMHKFRRSDGIEHVTLDYLKSLCRAEWDRWLAIDNTRKRDVELALRNFFSTREVNSSVESC
jgi:hypothetical protein